MPRTRRHFTPEEKVTIVKRHLVERVPISDLCDEYDIQPPHIYQWQKLFWENATAAFTATKREPDVKKRDVEIEHLKAKLARKDRVIAEISEQLIRAKKDSGEP